MYGFAGMTVQTCRVHLADSSCHSGQEVEAKRKVRAFSLRAVRGSIRKVEGADLLG